MDLKKLAAALIPDKGLLPPEKYEEIFLRARKSPALRPRRRALSTSATFIPHLRTNVPRIPRAVYFI